MYILFYPGSGRDGLGAGPISKTVEEENVVFFNFFMVKIFKFHFESIFSFEFSDFQCWYSAFTPTWISGILFFQPSKTHYPSKSERTIICK